MNRFCESVVLLCVLIFAGVRCLCGCPVWNNVVTALVTMELGRVATEISAGGLDRVCIEASLCSNKCLQMFQNNPYAF